MVCYSIGDRVIIDTDVPRKDTASCVVRSWEHSNNDRGIIVNHYGSDFIVLWDNGLRYSFRVSKRSSDKTHPCIRRVDGITPLRRLKEVKL